MKEKVSKAILELKKASKKMLALIICLFILSLEFGSYAISIGNIAMPMIKINNAINNNYTSKITDSNTMDSYIDKLISDEFGSRYAGRIWSDKSVNKNDITLDNNTDGYNGKVINNGEFLHTFSALGSSQKYSGKIPTNLVIVIDNSGSMYDNNKEDWTKTRISMTVEAVNKTINSFMKANPKNEISLVLFGDGKVNGEEGTSTAKTIIPMGHYDYSESSYLRYIEASWEGGTPEKPNHLTHEKSGGEVYVNNKILKLTATRNDYDSYGNGTTNIQAGIYQGMKELINAERKKAIIGDVTVDKVPALICLTDGNATDSIKGIFSSPLLEDGNMINNIFVNEFSDKGTSFIGDYINSNGKQAWSWNQFIEAYKGDLQGYEWQLIGEKDVNNPQYPTEESKAKLDELYHNFEDAQEYLVLRNPFDSGLYEASSEKKL